MMDGVPKSQINKKQCDLDSITVRAKETARVGIKERKAHNKDKGGSWKKE